MVSEDLCSEKQWSVCKALATFVAHRELSKVDCCPSCSGPSGILWDPTQVPAPFPISSCTFKCFQITKQIPLCSGPLPKKGSWGTFREDYALLGYNGNKAGTERRDPLNSSSTAAQAHQGPAAGIRPLCCLWELVCLVSRPIGEAEAGHPIDRGGEDGAWGGG